MKKILILLLLNGVFQIAKSQTITVIDQQTKNPLESVVIISEKPIITTVTNAIGQAEISIFKEAEQIQIRSLGYKTQIISYSQIQVSNFKVELEQLVMNLDQVIVSATRWRQSSINVPSKIVSISPKDIAIQNPQTAADLLGLSGKVFCQKSQQGGGSPMIRGFATNRLIYTIDGVRMNTAIFRGGNLQNVINLDPFVTENAEVLFGPGSVIYGSDAIGGVMSFYTLTPELSMNVKSLVSGKAITRYSSSNNEKTGHFDVAIGWRKWALITSFSSWDFDHLRQGSNGPDEYVKNIYPQRQDSVDVVFTQVDPLLQIPSAYSQINLMQKVLFQPNESWGIKYDFHYSTTSPYGRYDRHNQLRNGKIRYSEWDYGPQMWVMNNLSVKHQGNSAIYDQLNLRFAQQSFEESRIVRFMNNSERNTTNENVEACSVNIDLIKSIGQKHNLFYGVEYVFNDIASKGMLTDISTGIYQNGPSHYPNSKWNSIATYMNNEFRVSNKTTIQVGVRYNLILLNADFSNNITYYPLPFINAQINNEAITGSFGIVYKPSQSFVIKANFGTAFRSPNVDDVGKVFDSEPGSVVVPNIDLESEYAYNFDFGIAKVFGGIIKIDVTGYKTFLNNALVRRNFILNGLDSILYDGQLSQVQAIQNAAVANVYGVQCGLEVKLSSEFILLSDLNFQVGEEELDDGTISPSRHAAPLFGVSRLRYQNNDLTLELNAIYQGERSFDDLATEEKSKNEIYAKDENGNNYSPAWYTINLKAIYKLTDIFSISSGVENLTDQRYRSYSSGISGSGRNFILSFRVDF